LVAAGVWALTAVLGFQQFGLPTVLVGIGFAYSGSALYAWRKFSDRRKLGLPGIARTLHLKLTGAMLLVLTLDAAGYIIAVGHVPKDHTALIAVLEDTFVVVALLTISVGLILPGMIAHSAVEVSKAADKLVRGTLADFTRAMRALASGDLEAAKAHFDLVPVVIHSRDEVGDMALNFNRLQTEIGRAAVGLEGARDGLSRARGSLTETNERLRLELIERKQAEEVLRQLRDQHALILNSVGEGVHGIDGEGKIIFENPAAAELLGYEVSELLGQSAHAIMHHTRADGSAYPDSECNIYATLRDGVVRYIEHEVFWRKDGTSLPVDYTSTPIRDGDGVIIGATVVFTDITKRKEQEKFMREAHEELEIRVADRTAQLAEAKDEAVRANGAKSEFLSRMSHELRTPMNAILGFAQLMDMEPELSADHHESVDQILAAGGHLLNLINEVLDVTQIESGHMALISEPVEVRELLRETLDLVRPLAARLNIAILHQGSDGAERFVLADRNRLKQTLLNLLSNAIKYNRPAGHIKVECAVQLASGETTGGEILRLSVADTGAGIPPEKLERLFTPFDRLDAERTAIEGTGLGLSLSKRMVELMGGTLGVESVVGEGSIFWIDLPLNETVAFPLHLPASAFDDAIARNGEVPLIAHRSP
jgi:PAS domain S-box-containing protein